MAGVKKVKKEYDPTISGAIRSPSAEKKAFDTNQVEIDRLTKEIQLRDEYIAYLKGGGRVSYERWLVEREPIFK